MQTQIREILQEKGMTQKELAAKCGMSPINLSYFLNGRQGVTFKRLGLIADALGVPLWRLFKAPDDIAEAGEIVCPCCGKRFRAYLKSE